MPMASFTFDDNDNDYDVHVYCEGRKRIQFRRVIAIITQVGCHSNRNKNGGCKILVGVKSGITLVELLSRLEKALSEQSPRHSLRIEPMTMQGRWHRRALEVH